MMELGSLPTPGAPWLMINTFGCRADVSAVMLPSLAGRKVLRSCVLCPLLVPDDPAHVVGVAQDDAQDLVANVRNSIVGDQA